MTTILKCQDTERNKATLDIYKSVATNPDSRDHENISRKIGINPNCHVVVRVYMRRI